MNTTGYLDAAAPSAESDVQAASDQDKLGFVMNATRLWAHLPPAKQALFDMMELAAAGAGLTFRQRAVLVTATATGRGDPYCSIAWGSRLAAAAGPEVAFNVILQRHEALADDDRVLAEWAGKVAEDPTATTEDDVDLLRQAGFSDDAIFALTMYVALRMTFSTVNNALGARPDGELIERAPREVLDAIGIR